MSYGCVLCCRWRCSGVFWGRPWGLWATQSSMAASHTVPSNTLENLWWLVLIDITELMTDIFSQMKWINLCTRNNCVFMLLLFCFSAPVHPWSLPLSTTILSSLNGWVVIFAKSKSGYLDSWHEEETITMLEYVLCICNISHFTFLINCKIYGQIGF